MEALGIDLGTTNTVAAVGHGVVALEANRLMPSVVAFLPNGKVETGTPARRRRAIDAKNTIYSSKRIIGREWDDPDTQQFLERYPFALTPEAGGPAFVTRAGVKTPIDIAAILLSSIYDQIARIAAGLDVMITVPAGFGPIQRQDTLAAAEQAGFSGARLIEEPVSAARAYSSRGERFERVAVYDLGGGTFDFAVLECTTDEPRLLGCGSDLFLGGDDIDQQIAHWVATEVLKRHNWDLTNHPDIHDRLLAECERGKIRLSSCVETELDLAQIDPELPDAGSPMPLRRTVVDQLSELLVRRTFITCDHVLREVGMVPNELDAILLAGGSTHLPMIQRGVEHYFGRPGRIDIEPTEVVALGASPGDR